MRRPVLVVLLLGLLGSAVFWGLWTRLAGPGIATGTCRGCNLLLVTIDTLRADRVGAFGGPPDLTPTLDSLAREGLRLTRAYSSAPLTLPSHASIMTAVSPPIHGVRTNGLFRLGPSLPTLASVLRAHGYRTGAFVGAFVLDARFGLARGFDEYDDRYGEKRPGADTEGAERRAEQVVAPAGDWILGQSPTATPRPPSSGPWFAWVHLYDPHEPYRAPEPYASRHDPYDAEVAYADAMLGRLLERLRAAGALDGTLVIAAADHGESLGEHGERTHGVFVYDVTMRVPWIVWAGGRSVSGTFDGLARLIDLAPTALDLLGVPAPASFEGRSLVPAIDGRADPPATAYLEAMDANLTRNWAPLTALVSRRFKIIDLPVPELYDVRADPRETTNLYRRAPEEARTLDALLRETEGRFAARTPAAERTTLDTAARERLQALGYIAAGPAPGRRTYAEADDPKMLIGPANDLNRALGAFRAGSRTEGMEAARAVARQHPAFATAYGVFAAMQHDTGDLEGAIATLEELVRRGMADQSVEVVLAGYLQEAGALDRSAALLEAVVAAHPDYADAWNSLGVAYSRLRMHDRARAALKRVLALDPTSATAWENLGVDDLAAGDLDAAPADLARALALDPNLAGAHNALAVVCLRQHRTADAIAHWQQAIRVEPRLYDALYNLGTVLYDEGRRDEARPYLERFVREAPAARYAADIARLRRLLTAER